MHKPTPEQLDEYRQMTMGERMALSLKMTAEFHERLMKKPAKVIDRFFRMVNHENDMRNKNMLEAIARSKENDGTR